MGIKPKVAWVGYAANDCFESGTTDFRVDRLRGTVAEALTAIFPNDFVGSLQDARTQKLNWIKRDEIQFPKSKKNVEVLLSFRGTSDTFANHSQEILDFLTH